MEDNFALLILKFLVVTSALQNGLLIAEAADDPKTLCSHLEQQYDCQNKSVLCLESVQDFNFTETSQEITHIEFKDGVHCDLKVKSLLQWARKYGVTIGGKCASPSCFADQRICQLKYDFYCDGLPVLPCDFESNLCQWYQLSDSDFKWTRRKGSTPSRNTGPSADHTSGKGYYIYIETSLPRRLNDKARLVSPTLQPVSKNQTCKLTFYVHMYGDHIGQLNIYQAPVIGHDVIKKAFTKSQGKAWVKEEVTFDSDREFQIIFEGVRGVSYRGDIALDDVSLSPGCQRLKPAYVRLRSSKFDSGVVEVYSNNSWGEICYSGWNEADSDITCKELGFQSVGNYSGVAVDNQVTGFQSINCSGSESSIRFCPKSAWSNTITCPSNQTASLRCSGIAPVCPLKTHFYCSKEGNKPQKCVSVAQRCDFMKDCWDGSDETNCENYTRCTFEDIKLCGWLQARNDQMNWTRHSGSTPSPHTGPDKDHNGDASKYYIFANVAGRQADEKANIAATPRFEGNHEGLCKVRFFYHMFGWATGALRVLISDSHETRTVWEKIGSKGNNWHRAEVTLLNTSRSFQVIFEAEHSGAFFTGDIAIDDVSFTPECRPAPHENITCKEGTFKCTSGECISLESRCDFKMDCFDGFDEINCGFEQAGRCNFEQNFCDWVNETDDDFDFERESTTTPSHWTGPLYDHTLGFGQKGTYIYIEASYPRVHGDKARLAGPQFMWKDIVGCKMRFFYHMMSSHSLTYIGTLKVLLRNVITGETINLWQRSGSQGDRWILATVPIATNWSVAQIVLEATRGLSYQSDIAIDDISFSRQCYPSIPAHVDKNYDSRLVGTKSSYQGRVEVYRVGSWGTVCKDGWDKQDAHVVCRQLGYAGAVTAFKNTLPGKGQIWLDNLRCFGNESNLNMCAHNGWSVHDCDHSKDATAVCDITGGTTVPLRLSGHHNDSYRGVVEVFYQGVWGTICYDEWDLHDAHVACRQAGFLGIQGVTKETQRPSNHNWLSKVSCLGNEDSLGKCKHSGWGAVSSCTQGFAGVICKRKSASEGDIKLSGGRSPKEGRVEIFHRGEWGTVCEYKWTKQDAQIACFQLGFTSVVRHYQSFGPGSGRIWLHYVQCTGNEASLTSCPRSYWDINDRVRCTHNEDVGVICGDHSYVGCYKDNDPRVMPHKMSMKDLTPVKCLRYCQSKGYAFMGLEWSTDCYCGNHYDKYGNASSLECSSPCVGDVTKICGGPWRLSVYGTDPAVLPSSAPGYPAIKQSCSSVYYGIFTILSPIPSPNYFTGNHKHGSIWSPSFPANYPNNIRCVWVLNLLPNTKAKIVFNTFYLEGHYDYFIARDGKEEYDTLLTPGSGFTGSYSKTLTATSNSMWLQFESDDSETYKGFNLTYEALEVPTTASPPTAGSTTVNPSSQPALQAVIGGCNGVLHKENTTFGYYDDQHNAGYLKSPGYPGQYANNLDCDWTILVRVSFKISVTIKTLNLASGDFLKIGDGHTTQTSRDQTLPWTLTSRDRFLRLSFDSDKSRRKRDVADVGFFLTYERAIANGSNEKHKGGSDQLSGGSITGIVIGFLVLIFIILILVFLLIKNKKKRNNQGARHCFVNQAYDNTEGMVMANSVAGVPAAEGQQDPNIFYANAVAPPPYTPQDDNPDQVPPSYVAPSATPNTYTNLYSRPPPYQTSGHGPNATTTTGIGSVTSLREAANSPPAAVVRQPKVVGALPPVEGVTVASGDSTLVKSVLPAIGAHTVPLPDDQAGPLPAKVSLDTTTADNNNVSLDPATRSNPPGPLEGQVTRSHVSQQFDVEVPFEFICPISNDIMKHPVLASDGYAYERRAIKSWFRRNQTSPMTNERLTDLSLRRNERLEARIQEFVEAHSKN